MESKHMRSCLRNSVLGVIAGLLSAPAVGAQMRTFTDIEYAKVGSRSLKLDLYVPTTWNAPLPTILWLHGGGFMQGSKAEAKADAPALVAKGFAVAAIEYRTSYVAKWPAQLMDVKGAARYLRANAKQLGLDPTRFAAFGHSAGGNLASHIGMSGGVASLEGTVGGNLDQSSRVQFVVDFSAPTDLLAESRYYASTSWASRLIGKTIGDIAKNRSNPSWKAWVDLCNSVNPSNYVSRDDCPILIIHGMLDYSVPYKQSQILSSALKTQQVSYTLKLLPKVPHVLPASAYVERTDWFAKQLVQTAPFRAYGKGCASKGSNEPSIGMQGLAKPGGFFVQSLDQGEKGAACALIFGVQKQSVELTALGAPGCRVYVKDAVLFLPALCDKSGKASYKLWLPPSTPKGLALHTQWLSLTPKANALGMSFSTAGISYVQ